MQFFLLCTFTLPAVLLSQGNLQPTISAIRCLTQSVYLYLGGKKVALKICSLPSYDIQNMFKYTIFKICTCPGSGLQGLSARFSLSRRTNFWGKQAQLLVMSNCVKLYIYNQMTLGRDSKCIYKVGFHIGAGGETFTASLGKLKRQL